MKLIHTTGAKLVEDATYFAKVVLMKPLPIIEPLNTLDKQIAALSKWRDPFGTWRKKTIRRGRELGTIQEGKVA